MLQKSTRDPIDRFALLLLYIGVLYLLGQLFLPVLTGILWAGFLVVAIYPFYRRFVGILKGQEGLAAFAMTLFLAAVVVIPTILVLGALTDSIQEVIPQTSGFLQKLKELLGPHLPPTFDLETKGREVLEKIVRLVATHTAPMVQNIFQTIVTVVITFITMGVLFKEGPRVLLTIRQALPLSTADQDKILQRLREVTSALFFGIILTAAVQGTLGSIGWLIVGLSQPLTAGILMFVFALIPVPGTIVVWGPGALYLLWQGQTWQGIVLLVWGFAIVGMVDNFLKPIFISGRGKIHMMLVFFGIVGGVQAFGFAGLFLGPLVIILFIELLKIVEREIYSREVTD